MRREHRKTLGKGRCNNSLRRCPTTRERVWHRGGCLDRKWAFGDVQRSTRQGRARRPCPSWTDGTTHAFSFRHWHCRAPEEVQRRCASLGRRVDSWPNSALVVEGDRQRSSWGGRSPKQEGLEGEDWAIQTGRGQPAAVSDPGDSVDRDAVEGRIDRRTRGHDRKLA